MCGGEILPQDFDLADFCEVLQGKLGDVEVIPVDEDDAHSLNRKPDLAIEAALREALGEYCHL